MREPGIDIRDLLEGFSEPAAILDESRQIVAANSVFRRRFVAGEDPQGRRCHELLHDSTVPCEEQGLVCPLAQCLASGEPGRAFHRHRSSLGGQPVELSVCEVTRDPGQVAYFLHLTRPLPREWLPVELRRLVS